MRTDLRWRIAALVPAALVAIPVVAVVVSALPPDADLWRQQWSTRLPEELWSTAVLVTGVAVASITLGVSLAWLVAGHDFPGRRVLGWALVLPLALPAYILGFVVTSGLGVAGPVQTRWRAWFGRDAWFPEVRSMPMAIVVLTLTLFPYVYLMARAALRDNAGGGFEVARTLGAGRAEAFRRVLLPLLRPAIAAGAAIVTMEVLTDFATVQYFGVDTLTVGVFRTWRGTYDRQAATELACLVLLIAVVAIGLERSFRGRARYAETGQGPIGLRRRRLTGASAVAATASAGGVAVLAFGLPVAQLAAWALEERGRSRGGATAEQFREYLGNSLVLAAVAVALCVGVAVLVVHAGSFASGRAVLLARRMVALGYAVPGPVVAMGVVVALVALDDLLAVVGLDLPGTVATGSFLALAYAYGVRFAGPAAGAVESGLARIPADITAAARTLGAQPLAVLARVHLPLGRTSLLTAALLVGVDALKELPVVLLLRPFGFDTLSVWVYGLASESRFRQAALPALTIVATALVPVVLLCRRLEVSDRDR